MTKRDWGRIVVILAIFIISLLESDPVAAAIYFTCAIWLSWKGD